jgi:hypothetical protein
MGVVAELNIMQLRLNSKGPESRTVCPVHVYLLITRTPTSKATSFNDKRQLLTSRDNISSDRKQCAGLCSLVKSCMEKHNGHIRICQGEWSEFRRCHNENRVARERVK